MSLSLYTLSFLLLFQQPSIAVKTAFFLELKVQKKVLKTEVFNIDFDNKFIKFRLFCFSTFFIYIKKIKKVEKNRIIQIR